MGTCKLCWVAAAAGVIGFGSAMMVGMGEPTKKTDAGKQADAMMGKMDEKMQKAMEACMAAGTPGEQHKMLSWYSGNWDCEVSHIMNGETHVSKGSATGEMIFDGRYSQMTFKGEMMGAPFTGMSIIGYNNVSKKYESMWIDSMSTAMMSMTGEKDAKNEKVCNWAGEYHCPMAGKLVKMREVCTIIDDNSYRMDFYMPDMETGKETMQMSIMYKRAK